MSEPMESISVTVGDQTFRIRVEQSRVEFYQKAEARAQKAFRDIMDGGVLNVQRALAMTAFQLSAEQEEYQDALNKALQGRERLSELIRRIDQATQSDV